MACQDCPTVITNLTTKMNNDVLTTSKIKLWHDTKFYNIGKQIPSKKKKRNYQL